MATSTHDEGRTADRPPRHARRRAARAESRTSDPRKEAAILDDLREGKAGIIKLAAAHGVGVGTVQRIKASLTCRAVA